MATITSATPPANVPAGGLPDAMMVKELGAIPLTSAAAGKVTEPQQNPGGRGLLLAMVVQTVGDQELAANVQAILPNGFLITLASFVNLDPGVAQVGDLVFVVIYPAADLVLARADVLAATPLPPWWLVNFTEVVACTTHWVVKLYAEYLK